MLYLNMQLPPNFETGQSIGSPAKEGGEGHKETGNISISFCVFDTEDSIMSLSPVNPDKYQGEQSWEVGGEGELRGLFLGSWIFWHVENMVSMLLSLTCLSWVTIMNLWRASTARVTMLWIPAIIISRHWCWWNQVLKGEQRHKSQLFQK